ncbi:hypothetical protein KIN20_030225 [Parelaphostrongylus tenuis]|uniref:Uncharacterized protein n=1 Tax=Parelaphostrongylus tenuis TaxID=148309 RepID=A0AAD5R3K7_PARTN|nr:hypothetical protein KIN20_030225 [Parelaphostrongylus tenuis]
MAQAIPKGSISLLIIVMQLHKNNCRRIVPHVKNCYTYELDRMSADKAVELKPYGVSIVSLWPGMVRT